MDAKEVIALLEDRLKDAQAQTALQLVANDLEAEATAKARGVWTGLKTPREILEDVAALMKDPAARSSPEPEQEAPY